MRSVGMWPGSSGDADTVSIDFGPNLGVATISGTPTVDGINCDAVYVTHTPAGIVTAKYSNGVYAGEVQITCVLSDGRTVARKVEVRFC